MAFCKACGADVIWGKTPAGVKIALVPEPQPLGMLYVDENNKVRPWEATISRGVLRYESHSYNCPNAAELEVTSET